MRPYTPEDLVDHRGIAVILKNDTGEILVQEHVKYGFWTIPVGKVKKEQTVVEGFLEEIYDECDIVPTEYEQIAHKTYFYMRMKKKISVDCFIFEVKKYTGTIINKEPHKHKSQIFMSVDAIIKLPFLSDLTLLYLETMGIKRKATI